MDVAVAYRFNGEDPLVVTRELGLVCESLRAAGNDVFCAREYELLFRERGWKNEDIYAWCLQHFRQRSAMLIYLRSEAQSRGIELEIEDAKRVGRAIHVATPAAVRRYREHAQRVIEYATLEQLCARLRTYDFGMAPLHQMDNPPADLASSSHRPGAVSRYPRSYSGTSAAYPRT